MVEKNANKSTFEPVHNAHAIDQVAFGVQFDRQLSDEELKAAKQAIGTPDELPGRMELRGIAMTIGPNAPAMARTPNAVAGHVFTRIRADGAVETELQLQRESLSFRTALYTRWVSVFAQVDKYFSSVLRIYLAHARVTQVTLNYLDKFVCTAPVSECNPAEILQKNSAYLAPRIFDVRDLWHCHTGTFTKLDRQTKQLVTVNVDFITETLLPDEKERSAVAITTVLTNLFNQPGYDPLDLAPDAGQRFMAECFQSLHNLDKAVLRGIITPEAARRIALEG